MIPAVPNPGTADPNPLITWDDYKKITRDSVSLQADFDYFLPDALDQLQRTMRRTLLYAQYTERLYLYKNGQVYPSATPLDVTKGVVSPNGSPPENVGIFQGNGIWVGWYIPLPSLPIWQGVVPPQTDITYWGGYVQNLNPSTPESPSGGVTGPFPLPSSLKRIITKVVWFMLNPATLAGTPGGVKSVDVGGVSLGGDLSSMVIADPQLGRDIKRWRHPQSRAWDAQVTT